MQFEINGQTYSTGKMDAFKQFHVSRRIAPVLSGLVSIAQPGKTADLGEMLGPIANAIAAMPDADCDYVLHACLSVVTRQQGPAWARVFNGTSLMFDDIDMAAMLQIAVKVIQDNLGGFFQGAVGSLVPTAEATM